MSSGKLWIWPFTLLVQFKRVQSLARRAVAKITGRRPDEFDAALPRPIPKQIWMYWDTGEATAPPVVAACIDSWRRRNPDWTVTVLDGESLARLEIPGKPAPMTVQAYSDLVRLWLLRRHGGVWIDATVMCLRPLNDWLPPLTRYGFFAFVWSAADKWFVLPNVHRIMTSWFLASEPDGEIVTAWEARSVAYWEGRSTPHDYYWVHLILEYMILTDRKIRRAFRAMPKLGAYGPHLVHDYVHAGRDGDAVRAALESGAVPVQKLRWNWSAEDQLRAHEVLADIPPPAPMADAAPAPSAAPAVPGAAHG